MASINENQSQGHESHHAGGAAHGSVKEYVTGLILSVILTAIPFGIVMSGSAGEVLSISLILLCAVGQIFVQLIYFLHMNTSSEQMWNNISGILAFILVAILIVGSIWIMQHLNHNMLMGH
ncbi:cytochrome o ubiquinol oxidase subunit IV [Kangiella sp. HZ709]|uniref:cytochrome o ubiquinol oxidase subunit IV n=1 Tax=Kangiella sp. HZ709 TaxID=2666328 RepID=UPI0012B14FC1|nr:cytochrome o ubiquinol oxidase subunit IV [Kangiella sp. HZ709]MRX26830.1 cytochrome o ubiquinol oxidase subunit IV [Kangiella sp. HZ709]